MSEFSGVVVSAVLLVAGAVVVGTTDIGGVGATLLGILVGTTIFFGMPKEEDHV